MIYLPQYVIHCNKICIIVYIIIGYLTGQHVANFDLAIYKGFSIWHIDFNIVQQ